MNTEIEQVKCIIIGSGPAGYSAAIYTARSNMSPILICGDNIGGQLMLTHDVENYPGFADIIMGPDLIDNMQAQAKNCGAKYLYSTVTSVEKQEDNNYLVSTGSNKQFLTKTIIICTGATANWLNIPGEKEYMNHGVSGCATCDGNFFKNEIMAVVGGGDTAVEEALYLTNLTEKVYLIHRRDKLRASPVLQDRLTDNPKIEIVWDTLVKEIKGTQSPQKQVSELKLHNTKTNKISSLAVRAVFIAIGHSPSSDIFSHLVTRDEENYIITAPDSTQTKSPGIFAAGDVQDKIYRQAVTAAGTGCMAALEAERYLNSL